jgi:hypothetical protein
MPVKIEIPELLFKRLQKHATPFVDTPASVIARWADFFDQRSSDALPKPRSAETPPPYAEKGLRDFDASRPPDVFHTVVQGEFADAHFSKWNDLPRLAHVKTFHKTGSFDELKKVTHAQIRNGSHSDSGYHFVPEIGISIQNVDANHAWQYSFRLARFLNVPITAHVEWRHKEGAAYPGERGRMSWRPPSST